MQNSDAKQIVHTVSEVCQMRHITCLHAIESGSRAWGLRRQIAIMMFAYFIAMNLIGI